MKFRDPKTGKVFENITGAFVNFCAGRNCSSKLSNYVCPFREKSISTPGCSTWAINHPTEAARLMGYEVIEEETEKTFTETELLSVFDKLADSCDTSNIDGTATGSNLFDFYWKCGNANAVNFIKSALGIEGAKKTVEEVNMEKNDKPIIADPQEYFDMTEEPVPPVSSTKPRLAEVLGVEVGEHFSISGHANNESVFVVDTNGFLHWNTYCVDSGEALYTAINQPESIIRAPRLTEEEFERCRVYGAKWVSRDDITDGSRIGLYREKPVKIGNSFFAENAGTMIVSVWDESLFPSVHPGDCICVEEAGRDA